MALFFQLILGLGILYSLACPTSSIAVAVNTQTEGGKVTLDKQLIETLYEDRNPYVIPEEEITQIKNQKGDDTYGTMPPESVAELLDYLKLDKHDVIYDLGSGDGLWLIAAYLGSQGKRYVGIELSKTRHESAVGALIKLKELGHFKNDQEIIFRQQNIARADIKDATIIYMASTCYSKKLLEAVIDKIAKSENPDIRLVSLQTLPPDPRIILIKTLQLPMSWNQKGETTEVLIYVKTNSKYNSKN